VAGVVEVVLLVQLGDEAVGALAEAVEVGRGEWWGRAGDGSSGTACGAASRMHGLRLCIRLK
jgi:hypothetical protein